MVDCVKMVFQHLRSPSGYINHGVLKVSHAMLPEGLKVLRINCVSNFPVLAFMHWDSSDSLNLVMAFYNVDVKIPKFCAMLHWQIIPFQLMKNSLMQFGLSSEPRLILALNDSPTDLDFCCIWENFRTFLLLGYVIIFPTTCFSVHSWAPFLLMHIYYKQNSLWLKSFHVTCGQLLFYRGNTCGQLAQLFRMFSSSCKCRCWRTSEDF